MLKRLLVLLSILWLAAACTGDPCAALDQAACELHGAESGICQTRMAADGETGGAREKLCRRAYFIFQNERTESSGQ